MIKIFGCGIAGLVCGIELLKNGVEHSIIGVPNFYRKGYEGQVIAYKEKDIFAREGITPREYGIEPFLKCENVIFSVEGKEIEFGADVEIFIRGCHKKSLDNQLLGKYKKLGGTIETKKFSSNDVNGDIIIAADGYNSQVCKKFNVNKTNRIGAGATSIAEGHFNTNSVYLLFDRAISNYWYSYFIPFTEKQACVAVCLLDASRMSQRMERFKEVVRNKFEIESFSEMNVSLNRIAEKPVPYLRVNGKEIFFIGEAGGTVEPLAGFGISNAIASGIYCAESIAQKTPEVYVKKFNEIQKINSSQMRTRKLFETFGFNFLIKKILPRIIY